MILAETRPRSDTWNPCARAHSLTSPRLPLGADTRCDPPVALRAALMNGSRTPESFSILERLSSISYWAPSRPNVTVRSASPPSRSSVRTTIVLLAMGHHFISGQLLNKEHSQSLHKPLCTANRAASRWGKTALSKWQNGPLTRPRWGGRPTRPLPVVRTATAVDPPDARPVQLAGSRDRHLSCPHLNQQLDERQSPTYR